MNQDKCIQDSQSHLANNSGRTSRLLFDGFEKTLEGLVNCDSTSELEVGL